MTATVAYCATLDVQHDIDTQSELLKNCAFGFMQIPVAVPPNLDPAIAKQVIEYLKANPEAAQQSYEQAHRMLQTPGMAQMLLDAKVVLNYSADELQCHACLYFSPLENSRYLSGSLADFCRWGYACMMVSPLLAVSKMQGRGAQSRWQR